MQKSRLKDRIKEYMDLFAKSYNSFEIVSRLQNKLYSVTEVLFEERLQPTKGFLKPKVTDYVVPKNWGKTDPCVVTIFRHGGADLWEDGMYNLGNPEDVKTFSCPNFKEDTACTCECPLRYKNKEYFDLVKKQIPEAKERYALLVKERQAAWKRIFSGKTK